MGRIVKDYLLRDVWFYFLSGFAVAFLIAGFVVPPLGTISPSVLTAVGEIFAFGVLGTVIKAINMGVSAKLKHNNTSLTVGDNDSDDNNDTTS